MDIWISFLAATAPILSIGLVGLGWLYRHERERRQVIEDQVSQDKYKAYIGLLDIFFDIVKRGQAGVTTSSENIREKMTDANKNLIIYGSDEVIQKWEAFQINAELGRANLFLFAELIITIRKDMGNPKTKINVDNVLRPFIKDYEKEKIEELARLAEVSTIKQSVER